MKYRWTTQEGAANRYHDLQRNPCSLVCWFAEDRQDSTRHSEVHVVLGNAQESDTLRLSGYTAKEKRDLCEDFLEV